MFYNAYMVYDKNHEEYTTFVTEEEAREFIKTSVTEWGDSLDDFLLFKREMLPV